MLGCVQGRPACSVAILWATGVRTFPLPVAALGQSKHHSKNPTPARPRQSPQRDKQRERERKRDKREGKRERDRERKEKETLDERERERRMGVEEVKNTHNMADT